MHFVLCGLFASSRSRVEAQILRRQRKQAVVLYSFVSDIVSLFFSHVLLARVFSTFLNWSSLFMFLVWWLKVSIVSNVSPSIFANETLRGKEIHVWLADIHVLLWAYLQAVAEMYYSSRLLAWLWGHCYHYSHRWWEGERCVNSRLRFLP